MSTTGTRRGHQPATVRWSDGETTKSTTLTVEGSPSIFDVEFTARRPYLAVATVVTNKKGKLTCRMSAASSPDEDGPGGTGENADHGTFAMCGSGDQYDNSAQAVASDPAVELKTKTAGNNDWFGWASAYTAGEDLAAGSNTIQVSQPPGRVRLVVVGTERGDVVTCRVLVDGDEQSSGRTDGYGDIANCSATIE